MGNDLFLAPGTTRDFKGPGALRLLKVEPTSEEPTPDVFRLDRNALDLLDGEHPLQPAPPRARRRRRLR